jgi:hypothetical protein
MGIDYSFDVYVHLRDTGRDRRAGPSGVIARAGSLRPRLDRPVPMLPGISARGIAAIVQLERTRLWPGAAHQALQAWTQFLRDPYHRCFDPQYGCGELLCCPDPVELRGLLDTIASPAPSADPARPDIEPVAGSP